MKKISIIFLALCILYSYALADTVITNESVNQTAETLVSYTIEACKEYTVTIPSSVTIGDNQPATLTVSLDASKYQLNPGNYAATFTAFFSTDQNDFNHSEYGEMYYLTNGTDKIGYTIKNDHYDDIYKPTGDGRCVFQYDRFEDPANYEGWGTAILTLNAYPTGEESPGTYTTTLTFSLEVDES